MLLLVAAFVVLLSLLDQNIGAEKIIVLYNGKKYDLTEFHKTHPGGEEVLKKVNGKDVKEYLEGKKGVKTDHLVQHKHSKHTINEFLPTLEIKH
ncbi:hypothetical protein niasHT_008261 [Heterodera trifolii]|uniref:Cytochrome b5 heme-binding domain-containing protein n=1 Tax=Heterodera trifolii TaxID=157864 RepID=A0ABD2M1E2_9BILA